MTPTTKAGHALTPTLLALAALVAAALAWGAIALGDRWEAA